MKELTLNEGWETVLAQSVPIEKVVAGKTKLSVAKNGLLTGVCPFHDGGGERSLVVFPEAGRYACFACGAQGNSIDFLADARKTSYAEAAKWLLGHTGFSPVLPETEHAEYYRVMEVACRYYQSELASQPVKGEVRRYLAKRKVDQVTCDAYALGYAADGWDGLTRHLAHNGIDMALAAEVGLVKKNDRGQYFDLFRNRLMFTIKDAAGRPIGFGGRVLDDSSPKYINSPETPIYRKSEVLFGLDLARESLLRIKAAVVVEGYFDHLALWQNGVKNVVASCGTALTEEHVAIMKLYADRAYSLFDGDKAGVSATLKAVGLFGDTMPLKAIELEGGEDPDSYMKNEGVENFADRVRESRPGVLFALADALKKAGRNRREAVLFAAALMPQVAKSEPEVRQQFCSMVATACQAPETLFSERVERLAQQYQS